MPSSANGRRVEVPLGSDCLNVFHAIGLGHDEHPFLGFRQENLIRRHIGLARRDLGQVDLDADAAARRHLGRRRRQPGGAHVLDRDDVARRDQLEARFQQEFLGERIADLHLRAPPLTLVGQLLGRERGTVNAVPPSPGAHGQQHVAHPAGGSLDQILLFEHADAHRVDERIAGVAGRKVHLTAERRHTDAVAVVADAAHHAGEEIAITSVARRAEPQAIEQRDRTRAHREDIAQNATRAGRRPLVRLDGGGVVMGLDLERDRPAAGEPQDAGIFTRPLDHLRTGGRKRLQDGSRMLVGAVLAPQRGEDAELGERGRAAEHHDDARVFVRGEIVFLDQLGGDLRIGHFRVTPFATARNTRARMFGADVFISASASPASNQTPWQCVH